MNRKILFWVLGMILITCSFTVRANDNPMTQLKLWFMAEWNQNFESFNTELQNEQAEKFNALELEFESYMSELSLEDEKEIQIELSETKIRTEGAVLNEQIRDEMEDLMLEELEIDKQKVMKELEQEIMSMINDAFTN